MLTYVPSIRNMVSQTVPYMTIIWSIVSQVGYWNTSGELIVWSESRKDNWHMILPIISLIIYD